MQATNHQADQFLGSFDTTWIAQTIEEYRSVQKFFSSIPKFQALRERARALLSPTPRALLYTENSISVYRYISPAKKIIQRPVLVIPSLINKPCLMDLLKDESFIGGLIERGASVYMLEWGENIQAQRNISFEHYLRGYMSRACRRVATDAGADGVHLAGYCLGGTVSTIFTGIDRGALVKSLTTMVTPLNFHDRGLLSWWAREEHFDVDKLVDTWGNIPADFFSNSFPWLVPTAQLKKIRTLQQKQEDEDFLLRFLALDIWISENIDFPGEVYREIIKNGYQKNLLATEGRWPFAQGDSLLSEIRIPVLNLVSEFDHVSPAESCSLVEKLLVNAQCTTQVHPTGHLGFALGKDKKNQPTGRYLDEISNFLLQYEGDSKA